MFSTQENNPTPYPLEAKCDKPPDVFAKLLCDEGIITDSETLDKLGQAPFSTAEEIYKRYKILAANKEQEEIKKICVYIQNSEYAPFLCDHIDKENLDQDKDLFGVHFTRAYLNHALMMKNITFAVSLLMLKMSANLDSVALYTKLDEQNNHLLVEILNNVKFLPLKAVAKFDSITSYLINQRMFAERVCFVGLNFGKILQLYQTHCQLMPPAHNFIKKYFEDYAKFVLQCENYNLYEKLCSDFAAYKPQSMIDTVYYLATFGLLTQLKYIMRLEGSNLNLADPDIQRTFIRGLTETKLLNKVFETNVFATVKYLFEECHFELCESYVRNFEVSNKQQISAYIAGLIAQVKQDVFEAVSSFYI